jgi:hypothetical protein
MLGCHDFCGYYEWTFHYLRRRFGRAGLQKYWADAIAGDSQQHYVQAGREKGLRGLYESWFKTGVDEECEWTVTLDEDKNLLRLDMRECPSKGFLISNDLNADEDYCDHCIGWIGPALNVIGAEVAGHEHNHCGQCWWEMRMNDRDATPVRVSEDIRNDMRWNHGYLDRFSHQEKMPILDDATDPVDVLMNWFRRFRRIVVLDDQALRADTPTMHPNDGVIVSGCGYASENTSGLTVNGVLLENDATLLSTIAHRYRQTPDWAKPLLLHAYFPHEARQNCIELSIPRPLPVLPLLIRSGVYAHRPRAAAPSTRDVLELLRDALMTLRAP